MHRAERWSSVGCAIRRLLALLLLAVALLPGSARPAEEPVTLNFVNADIDAVATAIGQLLKRNFLIDPRVKGTINIVSARPVPVSAVYGIFLSALRLQGFTAVESGGITKILPEADAKLHGGAVSTRGVPAGDRLVTHVYTLRYASANQLLPVLRPIISPNNTITVYANNNSLVITDYADNLQRISRIIEAIDRPGASEARVIPLRNAAAQDVALAVNRILADGVAGAGAQGGTVESNMRVFVVPDVRTNSVIVRSDNPARVALVQTMVQQLDAPTNAAGNIHVVYLKNAEAVRVAQTLRAILSADAGTAPAASPAPPPSGAPSLAPAAISTGGIVQADPATNAVIILAPDAIFASLRSVIDKLDVRRAQVHVEALIVEMTANKAAEFGIQWQALNNLNATRSGLAGGTNFGARPGGTNIIDASANISTVGPGLNIGIVKGQINVPGVGVVTNLVALARALESDVNANILSTPNLLTLDNEEAKIVIGQNVPFITGQYAQTGAATTVTPFQTIERRDVGLTLRIKPQISEGGTVRLQIYQEVSSVQNTTNAAGVITNKRSIESAVLVDDGQIIALGGLVQDDTGTSIDKVPLLGDLPLLGSLFRYETRRQVKTNLMVFIRPVVLRDSTGYGAATTERYRQLQGVQENMQMAPHIVLPEIQAPRLPALEPAAPAAR
ncbi:MAG: type II secretion system secretin GspD [Candidatus Parcubacteria bacterium]|nr:type II secretion system secretin GspD [Burkholderiales bacterium]